MKDRLFTRIVRIARAFPDETHTPHAFETRLMRLVRQTQSIDVWTLCLPTMRRAAICGLAVLLATGAYIKFTESRTPDLLAGDLERTVLASVNLDETW